jgi:hypothetical protein
VDGDSKYCKGCIAKLEKALGLVDDEQEDGEEKQEDGVGGGAKPPTAPGVPVEPPSTAPGGSVEPRPAAGGDGVAKKAAADQQPAEVCLRCEKNPAKHGSFCAACFAAEAERLASRDAAQKKAMKEAIEHFYDETDRCKGCKFVHQTDPNGLIHCDVHRAKINFLTAELVQKAAEAGGDGAAGAGGGAKPPAAPGVSVEQKAPAAAVEQKKTYEYRVLCQKQEDEKKRKIAAMTFAVDGYRLETKQCAGCDEAKKTGSIEYCVFHQRKIDETAAWKLSQR